MISKLDMPVPAWVGVGVGIENGVGMGLGWKLEIGGRYYGLENGDSNGMPVENDYRTDMEKGGRHGMKNGGGVFK